MSDSNAGITVGRFRLEAPYSGSADDVAIYLIGDGEGGDFKVALLEEVLAAFYKEHF